MGYLPQVDDLLGLHPDAKTQELQSAETINSTSVHPSGHLDDQDPFAASSQALRMKSDSIALTAAQQQGMSKRGGSFTRGKDTLCSIRHQTHAHRNVTAWHHSSPINLLN